MAFQNISIHYQKQTPNWRETYGADAHFVEVADFEHGLVSRVELHHLLGRRQDVLTRYGHLTEKQQQDVRSVPCDCAERERERERVPCCGGVGALGGAGREW